MSEQWNPFQHHRGPYRLLVVRSTPTRKIKWHSETLPGTVPTEDIREEVKALLTDPRDTIETVWVYSEREEQFVVGFTRKAVNQWN